MIETTQAWKNYIVDSSVLSVQCQITLLGGAKVVLNTGRIMEGSLSIHDEICSAGNMDIGGTVAQEISFTVANHDGKMSGYNFMGATCVLYLVAGTTIQKGIYTLYTQNKVGRTIELYGYDKMANKEYNTPLSDSFSFSGLTCADAITALGFNLASSDFPNASYVLPDMTVGDFDTEVTARDILGYICEICGCYARFDHLGRLCIKYFSVVEFGDNLDGGLLAFWAERDTADGGRFVGAYGRNQLPYPYVNGTGYRYGLHWYTVTDTGSQVACYGTATANTAFILQNKLKLPAGVYKITGSTGGSANTYYISVFVPENSGVQRMVAMSSDGMSSASSLITPYFTVTDPTQEYIVSIIVMKGTNMGSSLANGVLFKPMILLGSDSESDWIPYQGGWTIGDRADGGLFAFINQTVPTVLPSTATALSKIMAEPIVSNDVVIITGVHVTGNEIDVQVGTDDYLLEITDNPFITTTELAEEIAAQAYSVVSGVNFFPCSVTWSADPSFEAGDLVSFELLGRSITTITTSFNYTLGGLSNISCNENDLNNTVNY